MDYVCVLVCLLVGDCAVVLSVAVVAACCRLPIGCLFLWAVVCLFAPCCFVVWWFLFVFSVMSQLLLLLLLLLLICCWLLCVGLRSAVGCVV